MTDTRYGRPCKICGVMLAEDNTYMGQMAIRCKECHDRIIEERRISNRDFTSNERHSRGCIITGEKDVDDLDWHHIDPETKLFKVGAAGARSRAVVKAEMEKCVVIRHSYHLQIHHAMSGHKLTDPEPAFVDFMAEYYPEIPIIPKTKGARR